jgi:CheY-like chemotaxis protein
VSTPLAEFTDLVRDALLHVYDVGYLQSHPLLSLLDRQEPGAVSGSRLRLALLDAIEAVRPGPDMAPNARAWRLHHILELRYIECHDVAEVLEQVALSSAQYHREHHRALQMVAVGLWERWQAASQWPALAASRGARRGDGADPVRREAEGLVHDRGAGRVDLIQVVQDLGLLLHPLRAGRAIDLTFTIPERLPTVAGERVAVRQLLLVLLSHAFGAVAEGTIEVRLESRPRQVVVTIDGSATGDPGQLDRGLTESRPFVDALKGTICAAPPATQSGRWTIQVCLPARELPVLLVVDNNAEFVRLVELYLTGDEWEVIGAGAVEEAVRLAQERHPDAILLDVIIPGRDGWDLLLELRDHPATSDIPAIVCSVLNEPRMATALGATAYLQKPVSQSQLVAALKPYH